MTPEPVDEFLALGVDVGSTSTKVALVRTRFGGPDSAAQAWGTDAGTPPATAEPVGVWSSPTPADVPELQATVLELLKLAVERADEAPVAIGVASMAETGAPLGRGDAALTPLLRWDRAAGDRDLRAVLDREGPLAELTGVPPTPKPTLVILEQLRRTQPDVFRAMRRWGGVADLVVAALTGELVTDHTLAARTMAYRLPPSGELPDMFDDDLLDGLGLIPEQFAEVVRPGDVAAALTTERAGELGLPGGLPVVVAGHDHAVGAWAAGVRSAGHVADSLGTTEALIRIARGPLDRRAATDAGMAVTRTVDGRHEALLAGSPAGGAMIAWWRENDPDGERLDELVAAVDTARASGVVVLPYPRGRQCPEPDHAARVELDPADAAPAARVHGLLEGLALHARWMLDEQSRLAGDPMRGPVLALGGPALAAPTWMSLKAALTPAGLHLVTADQPVACGAAMLAAARVRRDPHPPALATRPVEPAAASLDDAYTTFLAAARRPGADHDAGTPTERGSR